MNLHLFQFNFFVKQTQYILENINKNDVYVVLSNEKVKLDNVTYISFNELTNFIIDNNPNKIIIHYLNGNVVRAILKSNYKGHIHWSSWGGDLYNSHFGFNSKKLYDKETYNFMKQNNLLSAENIMYRTNSFYRFFLLKLYQISKFKKHDFELIEQFIPRINSCSTVLPNEYEIIIRKNSNIKYKPFVYGDIGCLIPNSLKKFNYKELGNKILVGNSGTPQNNHISVLNKTKQNQVICPVTYGNLNYIKLLKKEYCSFENIFFLEQHLPIEEYVKLLTSCNTLIINSHRQQALGNIIIALYLGMRVYLNDKTLTVDFLKELGIKTYSFEQDFEKFANSPLKEEEIIKNRQGVEKYWSKQSVDIMIKDFYL